MGEGVDVPERIALQIIPYELYRTVKPRWLSAPSMGDRAGKGGQINQ